MYIKNYSNVELKVKVKDNRIFLPADEITYVDENLVTLVQLKNMFGNYVEEITDASVTASIPKEYLKYYQTEIQLSTLYKVQLSRFSVSNDVKSIFVNSGSVNIYAYDGATKPTALTDMVLSNTATNIAGETPLELVPTYIAVIQNSGTSTEIVLNGIDVLADLGAIS